MEQPVHALVRVQAQERHRHSRELRQHTVPTVEARSVPAVRMPALAPTAAPITALGEEMELPILVVVEEPATIAPSVSEEVRTR